MKHNGDRKSMRAEGATAVIVNEHQRVLLHRRRDFYIWALPGGRIEPGETGEAAAVREAREETGYDITILRLIGEYTRPHVSPGTQLAYLGNVVGGTPIARGPETWEVKWFPLGALPFTLPATHRLLIGDAMAGIRAPVSRLIRVSPVEALAIRVLRRLRDLRHR